MPDYQAMYAALLHGLEDAVHCLERAQQEGEAAYLEEGVALTALQPSVQENKKAADQTATY
ncbi:MAG TPA: hypothetical protein VN366_04300 [Feifaniaceae bacterium]|nr:hypothetical protein [Feifaniaceae bacterium]